MAKSQQLNDTTQNTVLTQIRIGNWSNKSLKCNDNPRSTNRWH